MNVLIVGAGAGSWTMRGLQLGDALRATVRSYPQPEDFAAADVVVLVKRANREFAARAQALGKAVVWDALDFWRQPADNALSEGEARAQFMRQRDEIWPAMTIGATQAMATDGADVYLPHHSWAGMVPMPARGSVRSVAYQGDARYLGRWHGWLTAACRRRDWRFDVNPTDLAAADLIVSFRDAEWDGWMCRQWKSGVKAVNAIAAGRPFLSQDTAARRELAPMGSVVETPQQLEDALDAWTPPAARAAVVEASRARAGAFTLAAVGARYRTLLEGLV